MGSKVAAALDAYATFFRSVWRRAAQLSKLRRDGKLDTELENELAKGLGLEQVQHEQSVKTELEQVMQDHLEYLNNLEWGGEAFSMLPSSKFDGKVFTDEQEKRFKASSQKLQSIFEELGDFGGASSKQLAKILGDYRQTAIGETLLVDQGLKPLFHEAGIFLPAKALEFGELVKLAFPHLEAEAWDNHVVIWHPKALNEILNPDELASGKSAFELIREAAESDAIGVMLGNASKTLFDGDAVVNFFIDGELIAGGFVTYSTVAEKIGEARRQVFEMTFGKSVEMIIKPRKDLGNNSSFSLISGVIEFHEFNTERDYGAIPKNALYREVSAHQALAYLDQDSQAQLKEVFLASSPELALGQNGNKGITLVFDKNLLKTRVNKSKPGTALALETGEAVELIGVNNTQQDYQRALRSFSFDARDLRDAMGRRILMAVKYIEGSG